MTKKKNIVLIILGCLVGLFVALIILANVLITPERVRETVVPLAEEALDRKVELGSIDVSLFSGITLKSFAVQKKAGEGSFVAADDVVLRYSLLALLMFKVEIDEVSLVRPRIEIVRNRDGSLNFSDLVGEETETASEPASSDAAAPINLHVSKVSIVDGQLLFVDHSGGGKPLRHEVSAFNLAANDVSGSRKFPLELGAVWNGNKLGLKGEINLPETAADVEVTFNKVRLTVAGGLKNNVVTASMDLPKTTYADLLASIPTEYAPDLGSLPLDGFLSFGVRLTGDSVKTTGFVTEINGQKINLDLSATQIFDAIVKVDLKVDSQGLVVEKLLPPMPEGRGETASGQTDAKATEVGPFEIPVDLTGKVRVGKAVYNQIPLTDLALNFTINDNILRIDNLSAAIAGGTFRKTAEVDLGVKGLVYKTGIDIKGVQGRDMVGMIKPELAESITGTLGGEMKFSGAGTLPETVKKKLTGNGTLRLADGKLQNIPALNATAALLKVGDLREVVLDDGSIRFTIKDGQVTIDSKIAGPTTRLTTSGQVGLDGRLNLRSSLALSPELGGNLREQGKLSRYLGDEKGWTTVPLRIKGSYDSPDVGLDSKGLKKQAEKAVKQEVQKSIEKELQRGLKKLFGN